MATTQTDTAAKLSVIDALAANYGAQMNAGLKALWLELLAPYSAGQVAQAVARVVREYEFKTLPPFAVLKSALDDLTGTSEKALELQAVAEWGVLTEAIGKFGPYRLPGLHPTTAYVLSLMGGWEDACNWETKTMDFKRRDFVRLWQESHGRVEHMRLGAGAVVQALASGTGRGSGPARLGTTLTAIMAGARQ